jgi:hypothetical protein
MASKREDGVDTGILLIEILKRIPRRGKVTAAEIQSQLSAQGMDRSLRSIQRHLDTLSEKFDIERDDRSKPTATAGRNAQKGSPCRCSLPRNPCCCTWPISTSAICCPRNSTGPCRPSSTRLRATWAGQQRAA